MDPILKQKITDRLRLYLNREPSENEIINGQNDSNLMQWIGHNDVAVLAANVDSLSATVAKPVVL